MIRSRLLHSLTLLLAIIGAGAAAMAQSVQLTPTQQQMLNSLPPAQRQQALEAIRELQSKQSSEASASSINEVDELDPDSQLPDAGSLLLAEEPKKAESQSRLVVNFTVTEDLPAADEKLLELDPVLNRLVGSHLFVLDDAGILSIPGLDAIPLLGLDEDDIESRLSAETSLSVFDIDVRILGQEPIGFEALKSFGYDVFEPREGSLDAPATGPVPADYVLGPGDSVQVQLFGNVKGIYEYEITRDGILNVPEIGPVTAAGISFSEFRADLNKRVNEMLIGTQVSVTMGPLRTIRVFVLGDANQPGSYVVNGLATVSTALYRSGGISEVGSLRDIQLKRGGRLVSRLDLYDLLINGDNSGDRRLQPGDVIFIPPVGDTIAVAGAVKRPAIYEVRGEATIDDAIRLAGGLSNDAFAAGARLERIEGAAGRIVLGIDLEDAAASGRRVVAGDTLLVPKILPDFDNSIVVSGHVHRPGTYAWMPGMRLTDAIPSANELKPGVDLNYVLVRRQRDRSQPIQTLSADLQEALKNPAGAENIELQPRDRLYVFNLELGRQRTVLPIVEELRLQATHDAPAREVEVGGYVRVPGVYPLETGMRVSDLIRAGGSLSEEAYALEAELTRYRVSGGAARVVEIRSINLDAVLRGDDDADVVLAPFDYLSINQVPEWDTIWTVRLEGEVRFPGDYRVKRGDTLGDVLQRAGGLTAAAFPEGAVFLRETLKEREQEQIELLARRLESDLTSIALQIGDAGGSDTLTTGRALLDQLRTTEAVGRLVIDSRELAASDWQSSSAAQIELRDGDQLLVPTRSQVVTVIGETQQNTSHLYQRNLSRDDYINLSGGLTSRADKRRIYIVRANGAVVVRNQSRWLGRGGNVEIRPGDTIVVPLDADKMRPLTFWTNVTQILYQGAIAVAAIKTFE